MEELSRIQARLESLGELSELVGALRSMAAARAREAKEASEGTKHYRSIIERAIRETSPLLDPGPRSRGDASEAHAAVLLVVTSENGFVGGFNSRLIDKALEVRKPGERLFIVGRRGQITASERNVEADADFAMASRRDGVTALARRVGRRVTKAAAARIVFARPGSARAFEIDVRRVLPLDVPHASGADPLDAPLHHLPASELFDGLASEYLFAEIADALMASLASENATRLHTMDAASRNIDDRLEKLVRDERAARQEKTTSDMLDVVTGAEAVSPR
jgi:F-type H+-transporting ATPase subunit gamma